MKTRTIDVFTEIPCLTEKSSVLQGQSVLRKWFKSADRRYSIQYMQQFLSMNAKEFEFLKISPAIVGSEKDAGLIFRTEEYIGAIPLRAPDTGKQIGDFVVTPRYKNNNQYDDYIEILNLLDHKIEPETKFSLPLVSGRNFRPPLYLEATKYLISLEKLAKRNWKKFTSEEKVYRAPVGAVNWNRYLLLSGRVENRIKYPTMISYLTVNHSEYAQLKYVYLLAKEVLLSSSTPVQLRNKFKSTISILDSRFTTIDTLYTSKLEFRQSDPPLVQVCKTQANMLLCKGSNDHISWRVDYSKVFECFIQHIIEKAAHETGGRILPNFRIPGFSSKNYPWTLRYLEPDVVYVKNSLEVMIDAKYKSNLIYHSTSDYLINDHRADLHQILGYSSFSNNVTKCSILCYPANDIEIEEIKYLNRLNRVENTVYIFGVPLSVITLSESIGAMAKVLNSIEAKNLSS
jgi:hypothetical protein